MTCGTTDFSDLVGTPIRVVGCTLLLCTEGCAVVTVNFRPLSMRRGCLMMIFEDMHVRIDCTSVNFRCRYVEVGDQELMSYLCTFVSTALWDFIYGLAVLPLTPKLAQMVTEWFNRADWLVSTFDDEACLPLLRGELRTMLNATEQLMPRFSSFAGQGQKTALLRLIDRFYNLLQANIHRERSVRFYTTKLCISPNYFNKVCNRLLHQNTKSLINEMLLSEIKILLTETTLSVADIARRMNYDNESYLCRFFRNATGMSMLEFRERHQ